MPTTPQKHLAAQRRRIARLRNGRSCEWAEGCGRATGESPRFCDEHWIWMLDLQRDFRRRNGRAEYRCNRCGTVGHNRRSCAARERLESSPPGAADHHVGEPPASTPEPAPVIDDGAR